MSIGKPAEMFKPMCDTHEALSQDVELGARTTVQLSDCDLQEFVGLAERFGMDEYAYAVTPNVDHLIRYCDDASFRELYRGARYTFLDSRFLALILRFTTGTRLPTCPGSDLTELLFECVVKPQDRIVLIGSTAAQADILRQRYGLQNLMHFNPPMGFIRDPVAVENTLSFIEQQGPFRFCLLAVGCPQQEMLAKALKSRGRARGFALCVGASINFITGNERRAPVWMANLGIEWLFRLLQDPARLAGRYLLRGPRIFFLLPRLKFQLRSADIDRA